MKTLFDNEMKITAIAPYFGGKRNLASEIVAAIGPHKVYWEPFCGSMAVLMAKPPCAMETVCDLYGELINLARVLACELTAKDLYARLSRTLMCETLHREAALRYRQRSTRVEITDKPDVQRAYDYFLCAWLGRNGVSGTKGFNQGFCVRYTSNGGHAAKRWGSAVDSIPAWHQRLRNVTILNRDAFEVLDRIEDKAGTVVYCDPPYIEKGAQYVHDFSEADHRRLAEALERFQKTRVVVSYYDHPLLETYYPGWERKTFEVSKAMAHGGRRGENPARATEVLLMNGH